MRTPAAYTTVPHGQRRCEDCTFYHPERPKKLCSAFGALENKNGDCSLYIEAGEQTKEERLCMARAISRIT